MQLSKPQAGTNKSAAARGSRVLQISLSVRHNLGIFVYLSVLRANPSQCSACITAVGLHRCRTGVPSVGSCANFLCACHRTCAPPTLFSRRLLPVGATRFLPHSVSDLAASRRVPWASLAFCCSLTLLPPSFPAKSLLLAHPLYLFLAWSTALFHCGSTRTLGGR